MSDWVFTSLYPSEMLDPREIITKPFQFGSVAGSLGKEIDTVKKPGLNEDGALVGVKNHVIFALTVDGHYSRDATKYLLDHFRGFIGNIEDLPRSAPEVFSLMDEYSESAVNDLFERNATGEASFDLIMVDLKECKMYYYSVGDLMIFIHNPNRSWQKGYQISNRHYYEWISKDGVGGFHFGSTHIETGSQILMATDGLIDEPTISTTQIDNLFDMVAFDANSYVNHALDHNELDDNIAVICITIPARDNFL